MNKKLENVIFWLLIIASFLIIYLVKFQFKNTPETWEYGSEVGEVLYNLSLAIIASGIFYLFVVYLPAKRNKKYIYEHIATINERIIYAGSSIFHGMATDLEPVYLEKEIDKDQFFKLCQEIGPNSLQTIFSAVDRSHTITYRDHFNNILSEIKTESDKLFVYSAHLEPKHINLINDILYSELMTSLRIFFSDDQYMESTESFDLISNPIYDFYRKIIALKEYKTP